MYDLLRFLNFPSSRDTYTFIFNCFCEKAYKLYQFFLIPLVFSSPIAIGWKDLESRYCIVTDGMMEECSWLWGKRGHIECGGKRGTRPARREGKWAVGVRQQKGIDVQNAGKFKKRARHNTRSALCTEYVSCDPVYNKCNNYRASSGRALLYLSVSGE